MAELMRRRQQAEQGLDAARNAGDEEQRLDALARGDHMGRAKLCGLLIDRREDVTRRPTRDPDEPAEVAVAVWLREIAPPAED